MLISTIKKNITIIFIFLISSCIEPYYLDSKFTEESLVVEGMITNDPGPYMIRLSLSSPNDETAYIPYSQAIVKIIDDSGNEETLSQTEPGVFITDSLGIRGEVGKKYKISIVTNEGKTYESDYSELKEAVPIDDFYCEFELKHDFVTGDDIEGYRFYTKFQPYIDEDTYLMWLPIETFQREVPFTIDYIFIGFFHPFESPDTFKVCWNTANVKQIVTFENLFENNQQSILLPLNHSKIDKFKIKYSLLLRQLSVEKNTNNYWKAVNELNSGQSSFYNQQPYQIKGNISNTEDPDETVLGYFFAAGISKSRIFQTHQGLEPDQCLPDKTQLRMIWWISSDYWPIYIYDTGSGFAMGDEFCFDCRVLGGSLEKPDFWED